MPRAAIVGCVLCLAGVLALAQQGPPAAGARDRQRELAMSVADGFTVAAVGDCIIVRPVSQTPGFAPVGRIVRDADVAFGNFEGTYYRYAKRYEAIQNWSPPPSQPLRREAKSSLIPPPQ